MVGAQTLTVTDVDGDWENTTVEGGGSASGEGSSYIYWGSGDYGSSGYRFTAVSGTITVPQETPIKIGTFTHENWPVTGNTLLDADLEVTLTLDGLPNMVFSIPFDHDETPNRPDTYDCDDCEPYSERCVDTSECAYSTPANDKCYGCADRVQITSSSVSTDVDGISCTVTATFESSNTFYTAEMANNTIDLYIELTCEDAAKITVEKQTDPGGDSTSFSFSGDLGSFTLNGDGDSETAIVSPGTYTITENAVSGWTLTSITGDNNGDPSDGVTLTVADEDDVTVTFNNTSASGYVTITPGDATNEVGDAHTFVITAVSTGAEPDSWSLDSYSVTPTPDSVSASPNSYQGTRGTA